MPLLKFDLIEGRSKEQVSLLLDVAHRAMVDSFSVPETDRYQVVTQHPSHELVLQDTGLGMKRGVNVVVLQVVTRRRSQADKETFYRRLCSDLERECDLSLDDLIVSLVENGDADWSFGRGRAQFLTREL